VFLLLFHLQLLMAYKQYIGDFLGHVISLNSTEKMDQRFTDMIDDVYHFNIYLNRVRQYQCDLLQTIDEHSFNHAFLSREQNRFLTQ